MKNPLIKMPALFNGELVATLEPCRICKEKKGKQIGKVDYWDIKSCKIIACEKCNHIHLDPMLNDEETTRGCFAYYIEESLRTTKADLEKNCERNFRRGVVFGYQPEVSKISPRSVLELGPGLGYFASGLQFVFPDAEITVMDINHEVLSFNHEHHNFRTIREIPDNFNKNYKNKFDLIIARDIIEHVTDISKVLENVREYLKPNGLFHFITPNGHEDIWKHYLTFKLRNAPSELLINHVNYFDGKGLKNLLIQKGFSPVEYYTYGLKTTFRGYGWKENPKLMSPVSVKKKAGYYINEKRDELRRIKLRKEEILDRWYIQKNAKWITFFYCLYHHFSILRISPERNIGHEIYGLFKNSVLT